MRLDPTPCRNNKQASGCCDCDETDADRLSHSTERLISLPSISRPGGSIEPILPVTLESGLAALSRNFGRLEKAQVIAAPPLAKLPYCSGHPQEIASGEW